MMTVAELIAALSAYPGDLIVYKASDYDGVADVGPVVPVRVVRYANHASACEAHSVVPDVIPATWTPQAIERARNAPKAVLIKHVYQYEEI